MATTDEQKEHMEAWAKTQAEANRAVVIDAVRESATIINESTREAFLLNWRYAMAKAAMGGMMAGSVSGWDSVRDLADQAVTIADAMMARLAQNETGEIE